jgi:hypothetical protein
MCGGWCFGMVTVTVDLHDHHDSVLVDNEIRFDAVVLCSASKATDNGAKGIPAFLSAS